MVRAAPNFDHLIFYYPDHVALRRKAFFLVFYHSALVLRLLPWIYPENLH